ncbi:non-specific serine,threonine protein kinase [Sarracenia purpurea var. burkii]
MASQFLHRHNLSILFLFLIFILPAAKSDIAADRTALLRLRAAVGGRTRSWNLSDLAPCSWKGVYCDNETGRVSQLRLPGSGLTGQIPLNSIGNLTQLRSLSLRRNSLSGSLPSDLSSCTELNELFLQENFFSGDIPTGVFALIKLVRLNLAGNSFSGDISPEFNNLTKLASLDLENNNLTGSIPDLNNLSGLRNFNVSYNQLNGSIPSTFKKFSSNSFLGNSLCGSPLLSCPSNGNNENKLPAGAIVGIVIGSAIGLVLILVVILLLWRKYLTHPKSHQVETSQFHYPSPSPAKAPGSELGSPKPILVRENLNRGFGNGDSSSVTTAAEARTGRTGEAVKVVRGGGGGNNGLVFFGEGVVGFGIDELLRASAEVLGKGTFGTTYKAYLAGELTQEVVVKRLRNVCVAEREFREKLESLGMVVHENLVALRGYYWGKEEKLLVYDWMPMGSLSALLHGNGGADRASLTLETRTKIAIEAAEGVAYLHSLGPTISHGNIRSSNVLLSGDSYAARVSEYGISQLVSSLTSAPNLRGYCAPEVTDSRRISQKADVYSFGVLLLELLTGKDPSDDGGRSEEGVELPRWVRSVPREKRVNEVVDPELVRYRNGEEQIVRMLELGTRCTSRDPYSRPSMLEVTRRIKEIWS